MNKSKKGIIIRTEKVLWRGNVKAYKIISISALTRNKLPAEYLHEGPHCYNIISDKYDLHFVYKEFDGNLMAVYFNANKLFDKIEFTKFMAIIAQCGNRLQKIKKTQKELKKNWRGKKTYTI